MASSMAAALSGRVNATTFREEEGEGEGEKQGKTSCVRKPA